MPYHVRKGRCTNLSHPMQCRSISGLGHFQPDGEAGHCYAFLGSFGSAELAHDKVDALRAAYHINVQGAFVLLKLHCLALVLMRAAMLKRTTVLMATYIVEGNPDLLTPCTQKHARP